LIRTTTIELTGDKYKAEQLSLAHTNRLLHIFRNSNSFNNLLTNTHLENFYDDTGKFVGSIHLATNHGIEVVTVNMLSGGEKELEKTETYDMIVPLMRSSDNKYWVACLSGTFEGPYYVFENTQDISAEEMDDNVESELDGRMISMGAAPINGVPNPRLFFIAQTGIRPEYSDVEYDDSGAPDPPKYWDNLTLTEQKDYVTSYEAFCCPEHSFATIEAVVDYSYSYSYNEYLTVRGVQLDMVQGLISHSEVEDATYQYGHFSVVPCEQADLDVITEYWETNTHDELFFIYDSSAINSHSEADEFSVGWDSFRVDEGSSSNFCATYNTRHRIATVSYTMDYIECAYNEDDGYESSDDVTTANYFQVGSHVYTIAEERVNTIPPEFSTGENMMKYYGPESSVKETAIAAAVVQVPGVDSMSYFYVSGRSYYELTTTTFSDYSHLGHAIPDLVGVDADTLFGGEIFLGAIRLSSTMVATKT